MYQDWCGFYDFLDWKSWNVGADTNSLGNGSMIWEHVKCNGMTKFHTWVGYHLHVRTNLIKSHNQYVSTKDTNICSILITSMEWATLKQDSVNGPSVFLFSARVYCMCQGFTFKKWSQSFVNQLVNVKLDIFRQSIKRKTLNAQQLTFKI